MLAQVSIGALNYDVTVEHEWEDSCCRDAEYPPLTLQLG
jgi:hypothetical protein